LKGDLSEHNENKQASFIILIIIPILAILLSSALPNHRHPIRRHHLRHLTQDRPTGCVFGFRPAHRLGGSLCEAPLHMAVEKGFFDEEGLKYELIKLAPGTAFDAVTANQIDACFGLLASLVQPLPTGFGQIQQACTRLRQGACKTRFASPNRRTLSVKRWCSHYTSSPYIYAKRVLADNGVDVTVQNSLVVFDVYATADLPLALEKAQ
jgi:hypothetical protein